MTGRIVAYTLALATLAGLFLMPGWTIASLAIIGFLSALVYGYIKVSDWLLRLSLSLQLIATGNAGTHVRREPSGYPAKHGR